MNKIISEVIFFVLQMPSTWVGGQMGMGISCDWPIYIYSIRFFSITIIGFWVFLALIIVQFTICDLAY